MSRSFIRVTISYPSKVDLTEAKEYIKSAVEHWGGGLHPDDPLFPPGPRVHSFTPLSRLPLQPDEIETIKELRNAHETVKKIAEEIGRDFYTVKRFLQSLRRNELGSRRQRQEAKTKAAADTRATCEAARVISSVDNEH